MAAIYKREVRAYFHGITGYIFVAFLLVAFGIYTTTTCINNGLGNFEFVPWSMKYVFLIIAPLLSMRTLSEERRQKTDKLLFSNAVESTKIVLGKYFAMLTVLLIPLLIACVYPAVLAGFGRVSLTTAYSAMFGFFLMGAALLAIGMFASALTESQIAAAAIAFAALLLAFLAGELETVVSSGATAAFIGFTAIVLLVGGVTRYMTKSWQAAGIVAGVLEAILLLLNFASPQTVSQALTGLLGAIAVFDQMDTFKNGVFDIAAVVYYLSVIGVFAFFSIQAVEKRRWG